MSMRSFLPLAGALLATSLASLPALARVTPEEAARLGQDLTPTGAEQAGNADGSIPAWSGKWRGAPPQVQFAGSGTRHPDPYAGEQPLFTITAENVAQYADQLSDGQKALFTRYPQSFRMPVYPSHRDFRYAQWVEDAIRQNALQAELVNDGNGVTRAYAGPPFPIPQNGFELMWNHNLHTVAWKEDANYKMALTLANGSRQFELVNYKILSPWTDPNGNAASFNGTQAHFMITTLEPSRKKGEIFLGNEYSDPLAQPRQSWQYLPGNRRVRRAPTVAYDTPYGAGGFRVMDEDRLFNGAPDRYDWKLVGKKELYIPYHNYRLDDPAVTLDQLLATKGHLNPDYMRYEKHRVWVLEATLKPGKRHIYGKRVMYLDEDTWAAALADNYDGKGNLWRTNMQASIYAYELQAFHARVAVYHDLIAGSYLADRLINDQSAPRLNASDFDAGDFTVASLRKQGR